MPEITLVAPDISCDHCRRTIESELGALAGVRAVAVDVPERRVRVAFDRTVVAEAEVRARLEDIGYPVEG